jgi:hypothetical protein
MKEALEIKDKVNDFMYGVSEGLLEASSFQEWMQSEGAPGDPEVWKTELSVWNKHGIEVIPVSVSVSDEKCFMIYDVIARRVSMLPARDRENGYVSLGEIVGRVLKWEVPPMKKEIANRFMKNLCHIFSDNLDLNILYKKVFDEILHIDADCSIDI